jgi:RHS repeat-associated protein
LTDTLGVPMMMTDARGRVAWSASVRTYGELHHVKGSAQACPFRFQGQYEDAETGLHYNGYRYYDPAAGRYISQDPLGLAGGIAVYAYCADPLGWIDPLGLSDTCGSDAPGGGRAKNKLAPDPTAEGPHTSFKRGADGKVSGYETYKPSDPRNPNPWTSEKRVDVTGAPHYNKVTGQDVPTPHVQSPEVPGGVRPAEPWEIPLR